MAFLQVSTQWRTSPAGVVGLDYAGARVAWELLEVEVSPETMAGVMLIERTVVAELGKRRDG